MTENEGAKKLDCVEHALTDDLPEVQRMSDEEESTVIGGTQGGPQNTITSEIKEVLHIVADSAETGAIGAAMGAVFKFEQYEKNPTQIPLSAVEKQVESAIEMAAVSVVASDLEKDL